MLSAGPTARCTRLLVSPLLRIHHRRRPDEPLERSGCERYRSEYQVTLFESIRFDDAMLCISCTGVIQEKAEIFSYVSRVDTISYMESILLGDPFNFLSNWPAFKVLADVPSCSLCARNVTQKFVKPASTVRDKLKIMPYSSQVS